MKTSRTFWLVAVLALALFMAACGGGGGSGGDSQTIADKAYTGVRTQAYIDADNAEVLVLGPDSFKDFGGVIPLAANPAAIGGISDKISDPFKLATLAKKTFAMVKQDLQVSPLEIIDVSEDVCVTGTAIGDFDVNEGKSTATIKGDIVYTNCDTGDGVIMDGTTYLTMTLNLNTFLISKFAMTMDPVQVTDGSMAYALHGSISGSEEYDSSSFLVSHFTLEATLDDLSGHTFWLNNNKMDATEENFGIRSTTSGRYYDNDYGYVDFTTAIPVFTPYNTAEATYDGQLDYTGSDGSHATLSLGPNESDYCINGSNTSGDFVLGTCAP